MELKRVVITGLGTVNPLGNQVEEFWQNLIQGKSGAAPITYFDTTHHKTKFACEVKNFDPSDYISKKEARKMSQFCHYAIAAADECIQDSGMNLDQVDKTKIGVIWSSAIGGLEAYEDELTKFAQSGQVPRFSPFYITKIMPNESSGLISIRHGLQGINLITLSACASATNALGDAFNYIRLGKAKAIISGGSEASITPSGIGGFNTIKAISLRNDSPETASRPFDKDRDGFVMGEGAGALLLEELEHALNRGAKIYAEVVGFGYASDAYHIAAPHPEGVGAILAMQDALQEANLKPSEVDYLNAHATSTPLGDIRELKAIQQVFEEGLSQLHISATKSMTGHLLGAAGAVEAMASILAIQHQVIPPSMNVFHRDEEISSDLELTLNQAVSKKVHVSMSNTFGFGGHNAIGIFKKFEE